MSDDSKKDDLTRIENLAEFLHDEEEDFSDLETYNSDDGSRDDSDMDIPAIPTHSTSDFDSNDESDDTDDTDNDFKNFAQENTAPDINLNDFQSGADNSFEDNSFEDNSFEDNSFEDNSFEDNSFEDNSFEDNNFEDNSFEDNNFEDNSFEDNNFEDNNFEENNFEENNFEENNFEDNNFEENFNESTINEAEETNKELSSDKDELHQTPHLDNQNTELEPEFGANLEADLEPAEKIESELNNTVTIQSNLASPSVLNNEQSYSPPENFKDLQKFSQNISYGSIAAEGNPPFSVIIKDVKFIEDVDDIIIILKEFKLIDDQGQTSMRESLERGSAIIPRISEYAAIILCHKLRRFNISLLMGLSEEIHPAKSYTSEDVGLISKQNLYSNKSHSFNLKARIVKLDEIITSTTATLQGMEIQQYLGVATERTIIDMAFFKSDQNLESLLINEINGPQKKHVLDQKVASQNMAAAYSNVLDNNNILDENEIESNIESNLASKVETSERSKVSLADIYQTLIDKLKAHALKFQGNAVVGINFVVTPILISDSNSIDSKYQITCTGSVVWVNKN